jgi:hypothetical protein
LRKRIEAGENCLMSFCTPPNIRVTKFKTIGTGSTQGRHKIHETFSLNVCSEEAIWDTWHRWEDIIANLAFKVFWGNSGF